MILLAPSKPMKKNAGNTITMGDSLFRVSRKEGTTTLGNSEHLALFEENAGNIEHRGNTAPQVSRKEGTLTRGYQAEIGPLIKTIQISDAGKDRDG